MSRLFHIYFSKIFISPFWTKRLFFFFLCKSGKNRWFLVDNVDNFVYNFTFQWFYGVLIVDNLSVECGQIVGKFRRHSTCRFFSFFFVHFYQGHPSKYAPGALRTLRPAKQRLCSGGPPWNVFENCSFRIYGTRQNARKRRGSALCHFQNDVRSVNPLLSGHFTPFCNGSALSYDDLPYAYSR